MQYISMLMRHTSHHIYVAYVLHMTCHGDGICNTLVWRWHMQHIWHTHGTYVACHIICNTFQCVVWHMLSSRRCKWIGIARYQLLEAPKWYRVDSRSDAHVSNMCVPLDITWELQAVDISLCLSTCTFDYWDSRSDAHVSNMCVRYQVIARCQLQAPRHA